MENSDRNRVLDNKEEIPPISSTTVKIDLEHDSYIRNRQQTYQAENSSDPNIVKLKQMKKTAGSSIIKPQKTPFNYYSLKRLVKLCSIDSLKALKRNDKCYRIVYGNTIRISPKNCLDYATGSLCNNNSALEKVIIDTVWTSSFDNVLKSRETKFLIISNNLKDLIPLTDPSNITDSEALHLIFDNCDSFLMGVAITFLESFDVLSTVARIHSIGFLNCTFADSSVMKKYMSDRFPVLVALSIVDCSVEIDMVDAQSSKESDAKEQQAYWSNIGRQEDILRFELRIHCEDDPFGIKLLQLVNIFSNATVISQRVNHTCKDRLVTHFDLRNATEVMVFNLMTKGSHRIQELEFDMDGVQHVLKESFLETLIEIGCLKTFIFNGSSYDGDDIELIRNFLRNIKSLKSVEIKQGVYFPAEEVAPNILNLFQDSAGTISDLKLSGLKSVSPAHKIKLRDGLSTNLPNLKNLAIENSDIRDVEYSVPEYFRYSKRLQLTSLAIPGLEDLSWNFLDSLTDMATNLVKLDLSGFSRWAPRTVAAGTEPMDLIFSRLKKLKILILDDLSINDYNLLGKFNSEYVRRKLEGEEVPHTSLLLLKELEVLSLQNTNVSNVTVRCIARFMPNVRRLNVSFTHVNINALEFAVHVNKTLKIRAAGCGSSQIDFPENGTTT